MVIENVVNLGRRILFEFPGLLSSTNSLHFDQDFPNNLLQEKSER